jgi:glycosyltransferase involved in cell wall biosynthesis
MADGLILVAVRMLTYNHEKYIAESIQSVLFQKTTFPYKLIIGEDCSTDSTIDICIDFRNKYPDRIELLLNPVNDIKSNSINNFNACVKSGAKYIALIEGDDYWTDPYKLQKQIDFLEANPDFAICFHKVEIFNEISKTKSISNKNQKSVTTIKDLMQHNYIHTVSTVFRNHLAALPDWINACPVGDFPLHLLNAQFGKIKLLTDIMAVYRIHGQGIWGAKNFRHLFTNWDNMLEIISTRFDPMINKMLMKQKKKYLFSFFEKSLFKLDFKTMKDAYRRLNLTFPEFIFSFIAYQLNKFLTLFKMIVSFLKNALILSLKKPVACL